MTPLFVTATGTNDGKTAVACALLRAYRSAGKSAAGYKPICCGTREDAEQLLAASSPGLDLDTINPLWLRPPVAPYVASMIEERLPDVPTLLEGCNRLQTRFDRVVVEGAGGLLVPIRADYSMADFALDLGATLLLVLPNRLGCINHARLTVEAADRRKLPISGWIMNEPVPVDLESDPSAVTNIPILEQLLAPVPFLGELSYGSRSIVWHGSANANVLLNLQ
jgi:dethiobiotin synthetase